MTSEATGIGVVALALIALITKMVFLMADVIKQNAESNVKISGAVDKLSKNVAVNTKTTAEVGKVTKTLTLANKSLADKIGHVIRDNN